MKKIPVMLKQIFSPQDLLGLNVSDLLSALNDASIRREWMYQVLEELKRLNLEVDKRLLSGNDFGITDLAARRKAYQDALESILLAKRQIRNNNPKSSTGFDLDSVTVSEVE